MPLSNQPNGFLAPHHRDRLCRSGVCDDVIKARLYETVETKAAVEKLGFSRVQCNPPALVIPMYDAAGNQVGFYSGRCVCSVQAPQVGKLTNPMPAACPGVPAKADALGPKCFGAYQPKPQTCDANVVVDDDCDGRTDDPTGTNLAELGNTCGVTRGECVAGKVVGCNRGKVNNVDYVNPFFSFSVSGFAAKDKFLVCDAATRTPKTEICNGKDDDCDGALPGAPQGSMTVLQPGVNPKAPDGDEADHDGDKHLACRNCGMGLAMGILGCNDCNDLDNKSYPGASELCDGKDNACTGVYTDGKDDCKGAAEACCAGVPMCVDTSSNFQFCGGCALGCSTKTADACVQSACVCAGQAKCAGGLPVCKAGQGCVQCLTTPDCALIMGAPPVCKTATNTCVQCVLPADCAAQATNKACNTTTNLCVQCVSAADCAGQATLKACNTTTNLCVQCVGDMDCSGQAVNKACKVATFSCVQCTNDTHCAGNATKKTCDTTTNLCVACLGNANCAAPTPACKVDNNNSANNVCVECTANANCAGNPTKKTCDTTANKCIECTADANCSGNATKKTCDTTNKVCVQCLADAQCGGGTPKCKVASNTCVKCIDDGQCANPTPKCDANGTNTCVVCLTDADCGAGTGTYCANDKTCKACNTNDHCGGTTCYTCTGSAEPICEPGAKVCTCTDSAQCSTDETCDNATGACYLACMMDADCDPAKTATGKKCGAGTANRCGCVDNNDCPIAGTTCDLGLKTCLCGGTVCKATQACVNSKCQ